METTKSAIKSSLIYVVLALYVVVSTTPFAWALLTSLKTQRDAYSLVPKIVNFQVTGENYASLWIKGGVPDNFATLGYGLLVVIVLITAVGVFGNRLPIPKIVLYGSVIAAIAGVILVIPRVIRTAEFYDYFLNSIIIAVSTMVISVAIGALCGYALARHRSRISMTILVLALIFRAMPGLSYVLPFFLVGRMTGLYDTVFLVTIVLVATEQPFIIWLMRSFFLEIPREIEEAAMIDGASALQTFTRVIIPISWPSIITASLFALLGAYNAFLLPRLLTQTKWTLSVAIAQYTSAETAQAILQADAAAVSVTLPIVIVIIFFQKYLVKGLASGAVKG
jgi:multiple sugar transport system permease protein